MKKLLIILFLLVGCGDELTTIIGSSNTQRFEGIYICNDSSFLELEQDSLDTVRFDTSHQSLNSLNPENSSYGTHPTISENGLYAIDNKLYIRPRNYNYSSSTHDIEEDVSGSNITGNKRTDILVELKGDTLHIKIDIWGGAISHNINEIIASRDFTCERQ